VQVRIGSWGNGRGRTAVLVSKIEGCPIFGPAADVAHGETTGDGEGEGEGQEAGSLGG
jgi:hypothetical protein